MKHLLWPSLLWLWTLPIQASPLFFPDGALHPVQHLPDDKRVTETINEQTVEIGIRAARGNKVRGNVVLFSLPYLPQRYGFVLNYLRLYLPRVGWNTITVALPLHTPRQPFVVSNQVKTVLEDEQAVAQAYVDTNQLSEADLAKGLALWTILLEKIVNQYPSAPEQVIMVGAHSTAGWLVQLFSTQPEAAPRMLALIDPHSNQIDSNLNFAQQILKLNMPVMEVSHAHSLDRVRYQRDDRIDILRRNKYNYRHYPMSLRNEQIDHAQQLLVFINGMGRTVMDEKLITNPALSSSGE
jgi:hypothetical protein